ncbi:MAG TPA: hypothetical protein VGG61_15365 [Gemmataceae bacterium]
MFRSPNFLRLVGPALLLPFLGVAEAPAQKPEEKRVVAGKCYSHAGALLVREATDKPWTFADALDPLYTQDLLLALPGGRAVIGSKNGAVRATLVGNLPLLYPVPTLESAVILHANPDYDLDMTLARGNVRFANRKEKGAARIHARLPGATWDITLAEPGDEAAVEVEGRWSSGIPFTKDEKATEIPTSAAILLVLKGSVGLKVGFNEYALTAPPGPALYQWESDSPAPAGPTRMDKFPDWMETKGPISKEAKGAAALLVQVGESAKTLGIEKALADLLTAGSQFAEPDRTIARQIAVFSMGAVDDLSGLTEALNSPSGEVRDYAVEALRQWIGRAPKQDLPLYQFLVKQKKYSEGHADIVLQLLHSFGELDRSRSETYETLISYLKHDKLPIRELAWWHLIRIVPDGNKIAYDPGAPPADRQKGYEAWKKMLDDKKLPPGKPPDK